MLSFQHVRVEAGGGGGRGGGGGGGGGWMFFYDIDFRESNILSKVH